MADDVAPFNRLNFSPDAALDFQYMRTLASAPYGGASPGEVLHVARQAPPSGGDRDSYINAWAELGQRVAAQAREALAAGRHATARQAFLRAYNYLRAAEFYFPATQAAQRRRFYEESLAQFDAAAQLMTHPAEKISIPYENGVALPGYLFAVADDGKPRPTVIACGGMDGAGEEMYLLGGVPDAIRRGLNVIVFHGPGHRGLQLSHPELAFRPDAEVPLSAVVDYALNRTAVNGDRLALYGLSFGGYLAPRAAAHDRRIKALVANSPQRDLLGLVLGATTGGSYDDPSERVRRASWSTQAMIENYLLWNHGVTSLDAFLTHAANFSLEGMEEQIACPTLSLVAEGETQTALAQAHRFHQALRAPKHFVSLTTADGADHHCGVSNVAHTSALVYDWIAQQLRQA
ncbi:alpha/beta hydrolase family protein [Nonomuraea aridisoli]|uniref:Peptidase S9 prolyl oligopeptidase catalytic domain-containing protein n=1 Tax=Nonomuraea aridisoli TaxID=2070368 RepID=A0A2W2FB59_9ACTN|nr:prolyl oligopeptidase family serine peptidase [Nonomuraea aridisoli]PZG22088.1 hypothetical protein C1J01_04760 [Nonomuraea aridisoli]